MSLNYLIAVEPNTGPIGGQAPGHHTNGGAARWVSAKPESLRRSVRLEWFHGSRRRRSGYKYTRPWHRQLKRPAGIGVEHGFTLDLRNSKRKGRKPTKSTPIYYMARRTPPSKSSGFVGRRDRCQPTTTLRSSYPKWEWRYPRKKVTVDRDPPGGSR